MKSGAGAAEGAPLPALEQLRALAILFVLAVHTLDRFFPGGGVGVGIFYALSGYLVGTKLLACPAFGPRETAAFLVRRAMRLYPAYLVTLALIGAALAAWLPQRLGLFWAAMPELLLFRRPLEWEPLGIGVGIFWSLRVEAEYYLLLAFAMLAGHRRGLLLACGVLLVTSPFMAMTGITEARGESVFYYGSAMALGTLLAALPPGAPGRWPPLLQGRRGAALGHAVLLVLLFVPQVSGRVWWTELNVTALATCLVIACATGQAPIRVLPGMTWIGGLAYVLYLMHGPVIDYMRPALGLTMVGKLLWFLPLTFGLALALHRLVELPGIRLGRRWAAALESPAGGGRQAPPA